MYFYKLGYFDWEESPYAILAHNNHFTKQDFDEMVLECYAKSDVKLRAAHKQWFDEWLQEKIEKDEELDEGYIEEMGYKPSISDLYKEVIEIMKSEFDFNELDITHVFIPQNSYDILNDEDSNDEDLLAIKNRLVVVEPRNRKIDKLIN